MRRSGELLARIKRRVFFAVAMIARSFPGRAKGAPASNRPCTSCAGTSSGSFPCTRPKSRRRDPPGHTARCARSKCKYTAQPPDDPALPPNATAPCRWRASRRQHSRARPIAATSSCRSVAALNRLRARPPCPARLASSGVPTNIAVPPKRSCAAAASEAKCSGGQRFVSQREADADREPRSRILLQLRGPRAARQPAPARETSYAAEHPPSFDHAPVAFDGMGNAGRSSTQWV